MEVREEEGEGEGWRFLGASGDPWAGGELALGLAPPMGGDIIPPVTEAIVDTPILVSLLLLLMLADLDRGIREGGRETGRASPAWTNAISFIA